MQTHSKTEAIRRFACGAQCRVTGSTVGYERQLERFRSGGNAPLTTTDFETSAVAVEAAAAWASQQVEPSTSDDA